MLGERIRCKQRIHSQLFQYTRVNWELRGELLEPILRFGCKYQLENIEPTKRASRYQVAKRRWNRVASIDTGN